MNTTKPLAIHKQDYCKLTYKKDHYRTIFKSIQQPLIVLDSNFKITNINNAALDLITKISSENNREMTDRQQEFINFLKKELTAFLIQNEQYIIFEKKINIFDETIIFKIKFSKIINTRKKCSAIIISLGDITSRKLIEETLRQSEEKYRIIFENTGTATAIIEQDTKISLVNTQFIRLLGYEKDEVEGKIIITDLFTKDIATKILNYHYNRRRNFNQAPSRYEATLVDKKGNVKYVVVKVALLPNTKQSIASFSDYTARKKAEDRLHYLSYHDSLTGVNNRRYFEEKLAEIEKDTKVGIIMCDLDGLKYINDTKGHAAGDSLIINASKIIKNVLRENDIVARIGGDEFAILLPECDAETANRIVARIKAANLHYNQNNYIEIGMSIGFAIKEPGDFRDLKDVLTQADDNMYLEKLRKPGRNRECLADTLCKIIKLKDFKNEQEKKRLQDILKILTKVQV